MPLSHQDIIQLVNADFTTVNTTILNNLDSDVALIKTLANYVVSSGGKRFRPLITLLSARAVNDTENAKVPVAAAVIEYIHTATLIHDDVVDSSDRRRGKDTANNVWGNEAAVLVGDFLYSRAFQLMQQLESLDIQKLFADTTNQIAEGEVMQLLNVGNVDTTEAYYFDIITAKTAVLFSAACQVGGLLNEATPTQAQALADYGLHLGIAFQLMDDVLDYTGQAEDIGKNLGDDFAEGKLTLPVIHSLHSANEAERELITQALEQGDLSNLNEIQRIIKAHGGIDYCLKLAQSHAEQCVDTIRNAFDESDYTRALVSLAISSTERKT